MCQVSNQGRIYLLIHDQESHACTAAGTWTATGNDPGPAAASDPSRTVIILQVDSFLDLNAVVRQKSIYLCWSTQCGVDERIRAVMILHPDHRHTHQHRRHFTVFQRLNQVDEGFVSLVCRRFHVFM